MIAGVVYREDYEDEYSQQRKIESAVIHKDFKENYMTSVIWNSVMYGDVALAKVSMRTYINNIRSDKFIIII